MATQVLNDIQVQTGANAWSPPSSVTDHLGCALPQDRDFFVVPPREIGEVVRAYTSLKREVEPKSPQVRLAIVAVSAGAGIGAGLGLDFLTGIHTPVWAIVIALPAALIAWGVTGFKHSCNFVGTEGVAEFTCKGGRENLKQKKVFCFKDAWAVSTSMTRHFTSGVYTGTTFGFTGNFHYPLPADPRYPPDRHRTQLSVGFAVPGASTGRAGGHFGLS